MGCYISQSVFERVIFETAKLFGAKYGTTKGDTGTELSVSFRGLCMRGGGRKSTRFQTPPGTVLFDAKNRRRKRQKDEVQYLPVIGN